MPEDCPMNPNPTLSRSLLASMLLVPTLSAVPAASVEEVPYTLQRRTGDLEVRRYEPHLVAATRVEGDFTDVGSRGFRRLFDYIRGDNRTRTSLDDPAAIGQAAEREKIAMTAPVGQSALGERFRITFAIPAGYSADTVPEPTDPRITIETEPARTVAVIRYRGRWSSGRYQQALDRLAAWMQSEGYEAAGDPIWARYDPPFMPWFLRRNEILVPIDAVDSLASR